MPGEENGGGSVGAISLDLTVKDKLTEQINRIASAARGPAERIGRELEQSIEAPMRNVGNETGAALNEAVRRATENASSIIENRMSEITNEIREKLGTIDFPSGSAEQFVEKLDVVAEKLSLIQKKWQEISEADPFKSTVERAEELERRLTELERRLQSVSRTEQQDTTSTPTPTPRQQPQPVPRQTSTPSGSSGGIGAADVINGLNGGVGGVAGLIGTAVSGNPAIGAAVGSVTSSLLGAGSKVLGTVSKVFGKVSSLIDKLTGNAVKKLKELTLQLIDITRPLKKIASLIMNAIKGFAVATVLYGGFRAFKDGLLEAANANEQFSKSLKNVKANLGVAFMPIIQKVLPILNTLMARMEQTTKQVAVFTAKLFGMTYTEAADAYKKLKATAEQAKKTKAAVAGIDELNILSDGDDDGNGDSFDTSEAKLPDWAERLKDSLRSGDWTGAGKLIAQRINEALAAVDWEDIQRRVHEKISAIVGIINGFAEEIDAELIGKNIAGIINTITGIINGFADRINWATIGKKVAQGLNKAIKKIDWFQLGRALTAGIRIFTDTLYGFSTEFDWKELGKALSEGLNSAVSSIDTTKLSKAISNIVRGALQAASTFLSNTDFERIGEKIADFFSNIDVAGITKDLEITIVKIFSGAFKLANSLLEGIDFQKLGEGLVSGWSDAAEESFENGDASFSGEVRFCYNLFKAFLDMMSGIIEGSKQLIFKKIVSPFLDKVSAAFGIKGSGDSSEGKALGNKFVSGIISGAGEQFGKVVEKFTELRCNIENVFESIGSWFSDRFGEARTKIEGRFSSIGTWFTDRRTDITEAFSNISTWFSNTFSAALDNVKSAFSLEKVSIFFGQIVGGIKSAFNSIKSFFSDKFGEAYDKVTEAWDKLPQFFWDTWTRIEEGAVNGLNNVLTDIEEFVNKALSKLNVLSNIEFNGESASTKLRNIVDSIHIPRLATGGYATAPTLAMIGDNPNARTDPEIVSPLSKLQGLVGGDNTEVIELLRLIVELLQNGISAELIGSMFGNDFKRTVLRIVAEDNARRG